MDLPGEYNVSATFNVADLSPFDAGFDSRTNPFEEGGNDTNQPVSTPDLGQSNKYKEDPLHITSGPVTRARAKKIREAMLLLVTEVASSMLRIKVTEDGLVVNIISAVEGGAEICSTAY